MPLYRSFFETELEARTAVEQAKQRKIDELTAAATAAGLTPPAAAPTSKLTIEAMEAVPTDALPPGAKPYSRVTWRVESFDGRAERMIMTVPTESIEIALAPASGVARLTTTNKAQIKVTARLPSRVQFQVVDASSGTPLTIPAGELLVDEVTGKKYKIDGIGINVTAPGVYDVALVEDDSAVAGDVTYGSPLRWIGGTLSGADLARLVPIAQVFDMATTTVANGTTLTDPETGKTYATSGAVTLTSAGKSLSGTLSGTVNIVRTDALSDTESAEVGTVLQFDAFGNTTSKATVTRKALVTVPKNARLSIVRTGLAPGPYVPPGTYYYRTTADAEIGDRTTTTVPIVAEAHGGDSDLYNGVAAKGGGTVLAQDTLTLLTTSDPAFDPSAAGVSTSAPVLVTQFVLSGPQPYAAQIVGAPLEWGTAVFPATDGRWIGELFTVPRGT